MSRLLLIDSNYLCHRIKHTMMKDLSFDEKPTAIIFGFFMTLINLFETLSFDEVAFCWDSKTSKRQKIYPDYKKSRRERQKQWDDDERKFEEGFREQMRLLRVRYLKQIGFKNIFVQPGYEADDLIAKICKDNFDKGGKRQITIVTSDQDLYQCLTSYVTIYDPNKRKKFKYHNFYKKYLIGTYGWWKVKQLAGCSSDDVPGIKGIGEKTAIKYLKNMLNPKYKAYNNIETTSKKWLKRNEKLVRLPFEGTKLFEIEKDKPNQKGWIKLKKELGFQSLEKNVNILFPHIRKK